MAINLATDLLKATTAKTATSTVAGSAATDSPVAEFKAPAHRADMVHPHDPAQSDDNTSTSGSTDTTSGSAATTDSSAATHGAPTMPTLTDSQTAELKAAYLQVETALSDASKAASATSDSGTTASGTTAASGTDKTSQTDATHTDARPADSNPLVKVLTSATGETADSVESVLHQMNAVLRQEHATAATGADHGTAAGDAATLWHDRLANWLDHSAARDGNASTGTSSSDASSSDASSSTPSVTTASTSSTSTSTESATGSTAADGANAVWHHHVAQTSTTAPALDADVVSAVDHFVQTAEALHIDLMHGHGVDAAHLNAAA